MDLIALMNCHKNVFPSNITIHSGSKDLIDYVKDDLPRERRLLATLQMTGEARHLFCKVIHCCTVIFLCSSHFVSFNSVHEVQFIFFKPALIFLFFLFFHSDQCELAIKTVFRASTLYFEAERFASFPQFSIYIFILIRKTQLIILASVNYLYILCKVVIVLLKRILSIKLKFSSCFINTFIYRGMRK